MSAGQPLSDRNHHLPANHPQHAGVQAADYQQFHRSGPQGEPLTLYGDGNQTRSFC